MAAPNVNYYPEGYVVIPRKDYEEMIRDMDKMHTRPEFHDLMNVCKESQHQNSTTKKDKCNTCDGYINPDYTRCKQCDTESRKAPAEEAPKKSRRGLSPEDAGRIKALHDAGWSAPKIAEEIGCSQATVYNHIKKG